MRRTPAIALVGLLLGLSGCAAVPQRLGWAASATDRSDPADTPAPGRLTWWRLPRPQNSTTDQSAKIAETPETTQPVLSNKLPNDVWPESRSEWFARRFPLLNRRLNGSTETAAVDNEARLRELNSRLLARWTAPAAASNSREDDDVRTVDATASNDNESSDGQAVRGQRPDRVPPALETPSVAKLRPHSLPETSGDVALDINQAVPREVSATAPDDARSASPEPTPVSSSSVGSATAVAMTTGDPASNEPQATIPADAALEPVTAQSETPGLETSQVQVPASLRPVRSRRHRFRQRRRPYAKRRPRLRQWLGISRLQIQPSRKRQPRQRWMRQNPR